MKTQQDCTKCEHLEHSFIKIKGEIIYIRIDRWGERHCMGAVLATPNKKARFYYNDSGLILTNKLEEVKNEDLIKLWPHRTRKITSSHRIVIEDALRNSLLARGYILNNNKWTRG